MKLKFDFKGTSIIRLSDRTNYSWSKATKYGTCLKHGRPWIESRNDSVDMNRYEVYKYYHKDKMNFTYWFVENKLLPNRWGGYGKAGQLNTIEHTPLHRVELIKQKQDNTDYWIVNRVG